MDNKYIQDLLEMSEEEILVIGRFGFKDSKLSEENDFEAHINSDFIPLFEEDVLVEMAEKIIELQFMFVSLGVKELKPFELAIVFKEETFTLDLMIPMEYRGDYSQEEVLVKTLFEVQTMVKSGEKKLNKQIEEYLIETDGENQEEMFEFIFENKNGSFKYHSFCRQLKPSIREQKVQIEELRKEGILDYLTEEVNKYAVEEDIEDIRLLKVKILVNKIDFEKVRIIGMFA